MAPGTRRGGSADLSGQVTAVRRLPSRAAFDAARAPWYLPRMPAPSPRPRRAALLALACAAALGASPAAAAPADTVVVETEEVRVSAPRARTRPGGASVVEVGLDSTVVAPAPTLDQVLRAMPLVVLRANSRGEVQPALRGGEDRQVAVIVDGVPVTLGWDARTDLSFVPVAAARRVSLVRGLSSVLLGPNVLAGAVEVDIVRGPRRVPPPPPLVLDAAVDHTGARAVSAAAGAAGRAAGGAWQARAGGGYRGRDGVTLPARLDGGDPAERARLTDDGALRLNSDLEGLDGFLAVRREWRGGAWASASGSGFRLERGVPPEASSDAPRLWRYPYQARGLAALAAGTGMHATPWGRGDLEASVGADLGRTEIRAFSALDYRDVTGTETGDDATWTARVLGDHTLGARGDARAALTFASTRHREVLDGGPAALYEQRLWSLAGETEWRLGGRGGLPPVRLSAGAAADGADTPLSADKPPLGRRWDWGARLGGTMTLARGDVLVHGGVSRRVRFPALRELYSGALGRFDPNPGLRPEAVLGGEAGVTVRRRAAELQAIGFHQRLEDALVRVSVATPAGRKFRRVNLGAVTASGVELSAAWERGPLALTADLTAQRARGEDAAGGAAPLEYEPALAGGARADVRVPAALRLALATRFLAEQRGLDADTGERVRIAARGLLDLAVTRTFAVALPPFARLDATLAVDNALDAAAYDQLGLPLPGRTVQARVRLW